MAYCSDTALALTEKDYEKLVELAREIGKRVYWFVTRPVHRIERDGRYYAVLYWENTPWDGTEVEIIEAFLKQDTVPYAFARVGTYVEDNVWHVRDLGNEDFWELIEIHRCISIM